MSERIDMEEIARQTLGLPPANALERMQSERDAWRKHLERAEAEVADLLERNKALQARVDLREVIGELRRIDAELEDTTSHTARRRLRDLLRRLDRESQT